MRTSYHKVYSGLSWIFTASLHKMVCLQQPLRGRLKVGTSESHLLHLPAETSGVLNWLSLRNVFPAQVTCQLNIRLCQRRLIAFIAVLDNKNNKISKILSLRQIGLYFCLNMHSHQIYKKYENDVLTTSSLSWAAPTLAQMASLMQMHSRKIYHISNSTVVPLLPAICKIANFVPASCDLPVA